jgi:hypothetical protein
LFSPIKEGNSWKGNRYLGTDPYHSLYTYTSVDNNDLADWDYTYSDISNETIGGKIISNIRTVNRKNEMQNIENGDPKVPTAFASRTFATQKYAKGIGLVYEELIMWEYQPNLSGNNPYRTGFGVKRTLYDHN